MCRSWLGGGAGVSRAVTRLLVVVASPCMPWAPLGLVPAKTLVCVDTLALAAKKKRALPLNASRITRLDALVVAVIAAAYASRRRKATTEPATARAAHPPQQPFER